VTDAIEFRYLRPGDYDEIIRVWQLSGLEHRPQGRDRRDNLAAELKRSPDLAVGAFADGKLIGTAIGTFDGRKGCINRVAVAPEHRRSGIARRLISFCEEKLKEAGAKVLFCLIEEENQASIKLFEKSGYSRADHIVYLSKREHWDL
jgi:ribosomal protein S18 acetylase RimI-like enzyme